MGNSLDYNSHLRPDRGVFPLNELITKSAQDFGDKPYMRTWADDSYYTLTYDEMNQRVNSIAQWLMKTGVGDGIRVAVLGENCPEWSASYLATQVAGGVVVPVDSLMPPSGIRHILADSESQVLFVSSKFLATLREMRLPDSLSTIVCFGSGENGDFVPFQEVIEQGAELDATFPVRSLDELAAILYTSGTTGYSKGVMLSQRNIMSNVASASRLFPIGSDDVFLSVLPVHHSFECTAGFLLPTYCGCSITYARSLKSAEIMGDIKNTGVTMMVGVPLLFEKMHLGILRGIKKKNMKTRTLFKVVYNSVSAGEKFGLDLGVKLFKSLREKAGFSTVKFFVSGGGPLDPATAYFFNRLGIRMMQGYGLTETSPVTHVNPPWKVRHETVGPPIPEVECRIIEPNELGIGEICIKGPNVFSGYYKNEEATSEVLDDDGWFRTGDLGKIYDDSYLQIMGRKKNMLVTGGGKNVYPEEVEHYLNRSNYIAESLVLGIARESGYGEDVAALVYPDYEQVDLYFEGKGMKASPDDVYKLIKQEISSAQQEIAEYKRIRRFRIVEEEFQKTSTRKIKRFLYDGDMLDVNGKP